MNRIKTDPRNRLKTTTLDMMIRLSSEGPSLETFDYDAAVDVWAQKSNRRMCLSREHTIKLDPDLTDSIFCFKIHHLF